MTFELNMKTHRPETNRVVEKYFRLFPVYLRKESIKYHRYMLHVQPGIEFNLSLAGTAYFVVGERIYKTSPGQLLVFPGDVPHQVFVEPSDHYRRAVICVNDVMLKQATAQFPDTHSPLRWFDNVSCHQFQLQMKTFAALRQIAVAMYQEQQEQKPGWQQMLMAQLLSMIVSVGRLVDEQASPDIGRLPQRHVARELAESCCTFIESHLYEDLSLQTAARRFHVSPEHLTRTFKRETGIAFYQYVLLQRIRESKRLLLSDTGLSLTEIAYTLGFASSSHFSRTFRSIVKLSPSEYRLQAASTQ
ncbi:AraC family transcriptional regulator [Paenibacillus hodogayensis]|uniref:AraC family transcriptional regulator n=1 Tax=Paenibacillus hodogayensis TaxID=279208 RepID=A0ABV5W584_9BACL